MMATGHTKKYKELCLREKVELLHFLDHNSHRKTAEKFQVSKTCVRNIGKRKEEYLKRFEEDNESGLCSRKMRKTENFEVNQATYMWFQRMRRINAQVSGPMLQEVALGFAKRLNVQQFIASNGWLESFKKRHNISQKVLCKEANDVHTESVDNFRKKIPRVIAGFKSDDIFNADECGLYFRSMPTKSAIGDNCKDEKFSKERLTVLLACSAKGEKLPPLVIGKAKKPRCFKNINMNDLPVLWCSNRKAWMTGDIFQEWIAVVNEEMKCQQRNILLVADNCPAHPSDLTFSNVTVKFLPANILHLQPLDLGIIENFKVLYRKALLQAVIARSEEAKPAVEVAKSISILEAILWIKNAWEQLSVNIITACFSKAGFLDDKTLAEMPSENSCDIQNLIDQMLSANEKLTAKEFLDSDKSIQLYNCAVSDTLINDIVNELENGETAKEVASEEEEHCEEEKPNEVLSDIDILKMCKKMKSYALINCPSMLTKLVEIETMVEGVIMKKKLNLK